MAPPLHARSEDRVRAFALGALVVALDDPAFEPVATVRERCDPEMAALIGPHVTLTPPFVRSPDADSLGALRGVAARHLPFTLVVEGVSRFEGTDVVFLGAGPVDTLLSLREDLMATALFGEDPFPVFVPHVTLSESPAGAAPAERLGNGIAGIERVCREIVWVFPLDSRRFGPMATLP